MFIVYAPVPSFLTRELNTFSQVLKDQPAQQLKDFEDIEKKDRHNIQTHFNAIPLLQDVYELQVS